MRPKREDGETEELFRKFQGILNKLTPQKFQNLAEQALLLKIDSEERLKGCIDKIFTKVKECVCVCKRAIGGERGGGRKGEGLFAYQILEKKTAVYTSMTTVDQ